MNYLNKKPVAVLIMSLVILASLILIARYYSQPREGKARISEREKGFPSHKRIRADISLMPLRLAV